MQFYDVKPIINLYIYSSFHIALCASCLTAASYLIFGLEIDLKFVIFIGASTCLLYSLHRIIGIKKVDITVPDNRFKLIRKFRKHLIVYAIIAGLLATASFLTLPFYTKIYLLIPVGLSGLYILPVFINGKRLRDFDYIKIFLVTLCWSILCGLIPLLDKGLILNQLILFTVEKGFFIFAITLPFDYRDIKVDKISKVKTFAHDFKDHFSLLISFSFLLALITMFINPIYSIASKVFFGIVYFALLIICLAYYKKDDDMYISGILDGTMILYFLAVILHQFIFHLPISYSL